MSLNIKGNSDENEHNDTENNYTVDSILEEYNFKTHSDDNYDIKEDNNEPEDLSEEIPLSMLDGTEHTHEYNHQVDNLQIDRHENKKSMGILNSLFPHKGDGAFETVRKLVFLAGCIVLIIGTCILISTFIQSRIALADQEKIRQFVESDVTTMTDENGNIITIAPTDEELAERSSEIISHYKSQNDDVRGFLSIQSAGIYQPVVQGDDNDYYLTHTYYNSYNKAGAIFMDYRCVIEEDYMSPNIVLYGHNQKDGTMFGNLKEYKHNVDYYKQNPMFTFSTEYDVGQYVIFGYFVTNTLAKQDSHGEVFHYHDYEEELNDENTFNWYMGEIYERNQIITPVDVRYGDQLICLSTCSDEYSNVRFVIYARKLRENETADSFDFSTAVINPDARTLDYYAITSGMTYTTTTFETSPDISYRYALVYDPEISDYRMDTVTYSDEEETTTGVPSDTEELQKKRTSKSTKKSTKKTTSETYETPFFSEYIESDISDVTEAPLDESAETETVTADSLQ